MPETTNPDLCRALRTLVSDWQANGNSRPLGDPAADVWQAAAAQLLDVIGQHAPLPTEPGAVELERAAELVIVTQFGSAGLVARKLGILPNRAAELLDDLEGAGIVGPSQGSRARTVLVLPDNLDDAIATLRGRA